jgi:small subunit ribosomal protein S17
MVDPDEKKGSAERSEMPEKPKKSATHVSGQKRKSHKDEIKKGRDIGLDVPIPARRCDDKKCPFHGHLKVRGMIFDGEIVSAKMQGTVVVKRERLHYIKKYERFERRRSRIMAHLPACIPVKEGDRVTIGECRKIAKNVSFVVIAKR